MRSAAPAPCPDNKEGAGVDPAPSCLGRRVVRDNLEPSESGRRRSSVGVWSHCRRLARRRLAQEAVGHHVENYGDRRSGIAVNCGTALVKHDRVMA